jgi:hypothetical protein
MTLPEDAAKNYAAWVMEQHNPEYEIEMLFLRLSDRQQVYAYADMLESTNTIDDELFEDD